MLGYSNHPPFMGSVDGMHPVAPARRLATDALVTPASLASGWDGVRVGQLSATTASGPALSLRAGRFERLSAQGRVGRE